MLSLAFGISFDYCSFYFPLDISRFDDTIASKSAMDMILQKCKGTPKKN
jgi:hypothetical protein